MMLWLYVLNHKPIFTETLRASLTAVTLGLNISSFICSDVSGYVTFNFRGFWGHWQAPCLGSRSSIFLTHSNWLKAF